MLKLVQSAVTVAAALLAAAATVQAQDWPNRPIILYMGFPAGSGVDVVGRLLQPSLEKSLGQKIVIDYKSGAGGNLASEAVANARPDGYTFLLGTAATRLGVVTPSRRTRPAAACASIACSSGKLQQVSPLISELVASGPPL